MADVVQELVKDAINVFVYNEAALFLNLPATEGRELAQETRFSFCLCSRTEQSIAQKGMRTSPYFRYSIVMYAAASTG